MLQNSRFSGQPVFSQIVGLINKAGFNQLVKEFDANRYCKRCGAWEHFICMLYCIMNNCTSLREVTQGFAAYGDKLNHLGLIYAPPRSTFSEANARRSEAFFGALYGKLYRYYQNSLADSQHANELLKRIFIIDSTTISLFKAIMKCVGLKPLDGKRKGGIKVHTMLNAYETVPRLIHFTDAAKHDHAFLSKIDLEAHQIVVFDKGYVDYRLFAQWTKAQTYFVTRLREKTKYDQLEEIEIPDNVADNYIKDQKIEFKYRDEKGKEQALILRRVVCYDSDKDRVFEFLTNIMEMSADQIGLMYKMRWQIELLFKQLKQNFPLKYFLGDNENAIKIQIWCTLIANLLFTIIHKNIKKKISFSILVSFARQHLFSYNRIYDLIERAEKEWRNKMTGKPTGLPELFDG
jgi:hypothetical protein